MTDGPVTDGTPTGRTAAGGTATGGTPTGGTATGGTAPPVRLTVGDAAVARIAEGRARRVRGVVALRADLAQALLGFAGTVLRQDRLLRTDGVNAAVCGQAAEVSVTVVTRLGHNCRDVAQAVQREVAAEVTALTGLAVRVTVTVSDVLLD